jgi:cytosine/adenosine deaminase-related metal-dependent hydrolase
MATINSAHALHMGDQLGSIEAGKLADLAIVRGNPLVDIRNTRNVERVMVAGVLRDAKALLESVKGKMAPATAADDDWWKGNVRLAK